MTNTVAHSKYLIAAVTGASHRYTDPATCILVPIVQQFYKSRAVGQPDSLVSKFEGAIDLITLDNVYFDAARTLALVYMSAWCAGLCGFRSWSVFEKQGNHWEEKQWVACFSIS